MLLCIFMRVSAYLRTWVMSSDVIVKPDGWTLRLYQKGSMVERATVVIHLTAKADGFSGAVL